MTSVIYQFKIKPVINFMTTTLCYNFGLKIVNQDFTAGDPREIKFVHKFFYFRDVISCIKCSSLRSNHWLLWQITTHTLLSRWYCIRVGNKWMQKVIWILGQKCCPDGSIVPVKQYCWFLQKLPIKRWKYLLFIAASLFCPHPLYKCKNVK